MVLVKGGNDMQERVIENAIEPLCFEPMVYDLFMNGKLTAKGHLTSETPSEVKVKFVKDLKSKIENNLDLKCEEHDMFIDNKTGGFMVKGQFDLFNWKFKVIEIVDENNTVNIKINDIIEFSEKMKLRTAGGLFFSKEDKLIATIEENVGLRITESIKID